MALGFGFNKAKVLASAEKYVQQGKLQNAISEYEKVIKEDPKDLTVLNTIGDLSARLGNNDQAVRYFQKVGEAYAHDGFTVKAIAMYKKLTKLNPGNLEGVQRLAELYTVQGLYNDARQQYVQVADYWLKNSQNEDAAKIFQKILELDPDNTAMQSKLADLYIKLGKKTEARNIFFTAAQSLYAKQAMEQADEALAKVLQLDPKNIDALLLRGAIAAESGNGAGALAYLKNIPDVDSRPDALRSLLRAYLQQDNMEEADPIANKLIHVHNDLSGVTTYAEALLNAGKFAEGLAVYERYSDKVLAANGPALMKQLAGVVTRVKDSARALESLRLLFQKGGDTMHDAEIMELLAHAYVTEGALEKAKDLYQQLAENEPENPLHAQNYKQVIARLGEDSTTKPLSEEEGTQALMIDEVDHKSPQITYDYSPELASAVHQALTDSELFDSYNLPAKAIPPLESGLQLAPRDHHLNQRLVGLYSKVERYTDACRCAQTLQEIFAEHGFAAESSKFGELAAKYSTMTPSTTGQPAEDAGTVSLISLEPSPGAMTQEAFSASSVGGGFQTAVEEPIPVEAAPVEMTVYPPTVDAPPAVDIPSSSREITIDTNEWESMLVEEPPASAPAIAMEVPAPAAGVDFSIPVEAPPAASFEKEIAPPPAAPPPVSEHLETTAAPPTPPPAVQPAPPISPRASAAPSPAEDVDILGDLVADLEASLGEGGFEAPAPPPPPAAKVAPPAPAPNVPPPAPTMAAAASAYAPTPAPPPVQETVQPGFSSISHELPQEAPKIEGSEAASVLSDLFDEFKEDAEASATEAEDPETHYNLGIAFKEMGLLDEAIGELQKVCHAVERGHPFTQSIQAYTWLAQCLVDKGVPQAAVRWYEKALQVSGINEDSRLAVYYDLGCAYETAGNQRKAYETFMEVYSSNIDYRDVADRIKTLKT
jgi:tetratricopeptide (TPR) repeat protein